MSGTPTDRLRDLGERVGRTVLEAVGRAASRVQERKPLSADLLESDDAYLAVFDAAGATAGDVEVRFDDNTLIVRVERFREFYEGFETRVPGRGLSLEGSIELPPDASVDPQKATATVTDSGVLHVHLPRASTGGATEVAVSEAGNGPDDHRSPDAGVESDPSAGTTDDDPDPDPDADDDTE